ncbi:hypothetical protein P9112_008336 [Eukaryota sp. TZLM1-RC]
MGISHITVVSMSNRFKPSSPVSFLVTGGCCALLTGDSSIVPLQYSASHNQRKIHLTQHFHVVETEDLMYIALQQCCFGGSFVCDPVPLPSLSSLKISTFASTKQHLYAISSDNILHKIDLLALTSSEFSLPFKPRQMEVANDKISLVSTEGELYSLNASNGEVTHESMNDIDNFALGADCSLFSSFDRKLHAIDMTDNQSTPITDINDVTHVSISGNNGICATDSHVYVLTLSKTEVITPKILFSCPVTDFTDPISNVYVTPSGFYVVCPNTVFFAELPNESSDETYNFQKLLVFDDNNEAHLVTKQDIAQESFVVDEEQTKTNESQNPTQNQESLNTTSVDNITLQSAYDSDSSSINSNSAKESEDEDISDLNGTVESTVDYSSLGNPELCNVDQKHDERRLYFENKFSIGEYPIFAVNNVCFVFDEHRRRKISVNCGDIDKIFTSHVGPFFKSSDGKYFAVDCEDIDDMEVQELKGLDNLDIIAFTPFPLISDGTVHVPKLDEDSEEIVFVSFPTLVNIRQISACDELTAFVTFDGYVWLWNMKEDEIFKHKNLRHVSQISVSSSQGLVVLNDGTLLGWSSDEECGFMPSGVGKIPMETPVIIDVPPIEYVAVSRDHAICLTKEGTVYTFGSNNYGKCGVNSDDDVITPTLLPFEGVDHVAIGKDNSYFIKDNVIYACGEEDGLLRKSFSDCSSFKQSICFSNGLKMTSPQLLKQPWDNEANAKLIKEASHGLNRIAFGNWGNLLYVNKEGKLLAKGDNSNDVLGICKESEDSFTQVINGNDVTDVFMAGRATFFKTQSGRVFACGDGEKLAIPSTRNEDGEYITKIQVAIPYEEVNNAKFFCGDRRNIAVLFQDGKSGILVEEKGLLYPKVVCNSPNAMITSNNDSEWFVKEDGTVYRASPKLRRIVGLSNVVMLSVSDYHGLALLNDGNVVAWGRCCYDSDSAVEEVDLNFEFVSTPSCFTSEDENGFGSNYLFKIIPNLPKVKAIAAGNYYSLFVTEEGKVLVIGDNDKGQLGLGEVEKAEVLTEIPNIENVSGVKAFEDSAVLVSNGELYISGELGKFFFGEPCTTFTKIPEVKYTPCLDYSKLGFVEPIDIDYSKDETRINYLNRIRTDDELADIIVVNENEFVFNHDSNHGKMTLTFPNIQRLFAIEDLPVVCTKDLTYYIIDSDYKDPEEVYHSIKGLDSIEMKHFVLSEEFFFGLDTNGNLYLINEDLEADEFTRLKNVRQISLFKSSAAFVTFDGLLWLWDKDSYGATNGQLIRHPCLLNVKQAAIGELDYYHHLHLVVLNDGTLLGWGNTKLLGFGDHDSDKIPMETPVIIDVPPIEYVAVSGDHAICLTKEGTVYTFGSNNYGKCGVDSDDEVIPPTLLSFEGVDHVAISENNSYFIKDDVIYACGKCNGIFAKTLPLHQFKPTISLLTGVKSRPLAKPLTDWSVEDNSLVLKNAMQNLGRIAQYGDRLVYVNNEGIVIGTGSNHSYQLGLGHSDAVSEFVQIPLLSSIQSLYLSKNFSLFQSLEGEVYGCGRYLDAFESLTDEVIIDGSQKFVMILGNLGFINGVFNDFSKSVLLLNGTATLHEKGFEPITLLSDVVQMVVSDINSFWLLTSSGNVYRYFRSLKRIIGLSRVVLLSVSKTHGLALLDDGSVVSWGKATFNALGYDFDDVPDDVYLDDGDGSVPEYSDSEDEFGFSTHETFHYKIIPNLPKVKAIATGNYYSLFVTEEGKVLVIGDNDKGQIGLGEVEKAEVLTEIPNIENVSGVKAFEDSSVLVSNAELYISGELGKFFFGEPCTTFTKIPEVKYTPCLDYSKLGFVEPNDIDYSKDETRINYLNRIRSLGSWEFYFLDSKQNYCKRHSGTIVGFPLGDDVVEIYMVEVCPIICNSKGQYFIINNADKSERHHISGLDNVKVKYFCRYGSLFNEFSEVLALTTEGNVYIIKLSRRTSIPTGEAQLLSEISNVRQMTFASGFCTFVTFDGSLYYWNRNDSDASLVRHPTLRNVKQVAIGTISHLTESIFVVLNDGTLLGSGRKCYLGFGDHKSDEIPMETPVIIDVPPIEYVAVSRDHAICLTKEGTVYTFGSNNYGKCGVNSDDEVITPTLLPFEGVDHVATGEDCTFLIKDDQLYRCGMHNDSLCGDSSGFVPVASFKYGCALKDLDKAIEEYEKKECIVEEQEGNQHNVEEVTKEVEVDQEESTEQVETQPAVDDSVTKEVEVDQEESTEQVETQPTVDDSVTKEVEVDQEESIEQVETQPTVDDSVTKEVEVDQEESIEQVETQPAVDDSVTKEVEVDQEKSTEQVETQPTVDDSVTKAVEVDQEESTEQVETQPAVDDSVTKEVEVDQEESTEQVETQPAVDDSVTKEVEVDQEESTEQVETQPTVDDSVTKEVEVDQEESIEQVETQPTVDDSVTKAVEVDQEESTEQVETQPAVDDSVTKEVEVDQEESTEQVETQPAVDDSVTKEVEVDQEESTEQVETQPAVDDSVTKEVEVDQEESIEQVETQPAVDDSVTKVVEVDQEESTEQVETQPAVDDSVTKEVEVDQEESIEQVETQPAVDDSVTKEVEVDQEESTEQVETQPTVDDSVTKAVEVDQEESTEQVETPVVISTKGDNFETVVKSPLSSVQSQLPLDICHQGYLTKQGGFFKTWKRRWFVLKECTLSYYADPFDTNAKKRLVIEKDSIVKELSLTQYKSLKFQKARSLYLVFQSQPGQREFYLLASSREERDYWIDRISAAIPTI